MTAGLLFLDSSESELIPGLVPGTQFNVYQTPDFEAEGPQFTLGDDLILVPFTIDALILDGVYFTTFFDDWYNRIHLSPRRFDLANVISDQTREVLLWNGYLEDKTLASVSFPTGQGVSVIDPVGSPYVLRPLEDVFYTIVVSADGPPTLDLTLEWDITGEDDLTVAITGRRIVVWPFQPNWARPYVESLDWLTDVITAFSGDEQRIQLRSKPRRSFEYSARVTESDAAIMQNLLWGWQNRNYALPLWADRSHLTVAATTGDITLNLDTTNRGYYAGGLVILLEDALTYEVVEIASVTSSTLVLAKLLERNWPIRTQAYPINISRLPTNVASTRLTDGIAEIALTFNTDPLQTSPNIPDVAASTVHDGYEVILRKPNWAQPVQVINEFMYDTADFNVGGVVTAPTRVFPQVMRRFQWVLKTRDDIQIFRALLGRLRGRHRSAYLPTWFDDFKLYDVETASAVSIRLQNNEFFKMVGLDPALKTIMILTHGNNPVIRRIDSISSDPSGFTVLGLNAAVGVDMNPGTLQRISLVHLCRLTSDRVTINYLSDSVATVEANFTLVKA